MKESNTLVGNASNNFLRRDLFLNTKGQYMRESNTLVDYATINFLIRETKLNTKELSMKVFDQIT